MGPPSINVEIWPKPRSAEYVERALAEVSPLPDLDHLHNDRFIGLHNCSGARVHAHHLPVLRTDGDNLGLRGFLRYQRPARRGMGIRWLSRCGARRLGG